MNESPREKIVIVAHAGSPCRELVTLTRHADVGQDRTSTPDGVRLARCLDVVPGLAWCFDDDPWTVRVRPVHEQLRPWAEIEPEVVAAFVSAYGVELDVVRDNRTEAGS